MLNETLYGFENVQLSMTVVVGKPFFIFLLCVDFSSGPRTAGGRFESRFPESFVMNSLAASLVNGLDESDNANSHKSVLGTSVDQSNHVNTHNICNCVLVCE